ncbi:MAG: hypothetical protein JXR78_02935 [Victivallales bacterium]|nr:hypothetical protein [Victivallales bacterium]
MKFFRKISLGLIILTGSLSTLIIQADEKSNTPVIILKLDDLTYKPNNESWQRCLDFLAEKKIKCSAGIICYALDKECSSLFDFVKEEHAKGNIEFWCHGYRNRKASDPTGEFEGSFEEQKAALEKCQKLAQEKLGFKFKAFGPHWSKTNADTARALKAIPEFTIWLYGKPDLETASGKYVYPRVMALEYKTFVPDVNKFKAKYFKEGIKHKCLVLQGHPMAWVKDQRWENFVAIIDFLISRNTVFMTPSEYYEKEVNGHK